MENFCDITKNRIVQQNFILYSFSHPLLFSFYNKMNHDKWDEFVSLTNP